MCHFCRYLNYDFHYFQRIILIDCRLLVRRKWQILLLSNISSINDGYVKLYDTSTPLRVLSITYQFWTLFNLAFESWDYRTVTINKILQYRSVNIYHLRFGWDREIDNKCTILPLETSQKNSSGFSRTKSTKTPYFSRKQGARITVVIGLWRPTVYIIPSLTLTHRHGDHYNTPPAF